MLDKINAFLFTQGEALLGLTDGSLWYPVCRVSMLIVAVSILHMTITRLITPLMRKVLLRSSIPLIGYLLKHKLFLNVLRLFPLILLRYGSGFIAHSTIEAGLLKTTNILIVIACAKLVYSIINAVYDHLEHRKMTRNAPIKSISQMLKVITITISLIMVVSLLMNKSPAYLLSGLGALSAVLLLVFKDPLINLFAGLQITSQKLIRVGDWVQTDKVDGEVVSINMVNATIRGWANEMHTVSLSNLLDGVNWREMYGLGRRIKRSYFIDIDTVKFLSEKDINHYSQYHLLRNYIDGKKQEQPQWGADELFCENQPVQNREMTNIGMFRMYIKHYLINHPKVNNEATILIRHLNSTPQGVPLECYFFVKPEHSGWVDTEEMAADLGDWIMAMAKKFELRIFQSPSQFGLSKALQHGDAPAASVIPFSQVSNLNATNR